MKVLNAVEKVSNLAKNNSVRGCKVARRRRPRRRVTATELLNIIIGTYNKYLFSQRNFVPSL